ncbi:DUF4240 domain-containing protein [Streptomyces sp. NBC_00385]|uniref:DUF4240 domain-containing protein n=1 Tax=Streptomyces sp. NBC_00385 TaxID=2975733 RepID=UPI002DD7FA82|nr:DUF4240 domain-containing protein [Streptomyces sp. NBC_00385]WRZ06551.1 DUF4240 domain-containing protein [Streptomyces sp. NBC_00385]
MDTKDFWKLIDDARTLVVDPADAEAVAGRATALLAERPADEILTAQQLLWDLMAASYRAPLWAAAYTINGGCSDDGFDYFRGWLIAQGREVFERVVTAPDTLAGLPVVRAAAAEEVDLECEAVLGVAWDAYLEATGEKLPQDAFTIDYPELDPEWDFDFDDAERVALRLPQLDALYG